MSGKGQGPCKNCGSSREACDARITKYPKRCCDTCKQNGPALTHKDAPPPSDLEQMIDGYNELREQCVKLAKENRGELMGSDAWPSAALQDGDITLNYTLEGVQCSGTTYTMQTMSSEWFDFIIPFDRLAK